MSFPCVSCGCCCRKTAQISDELLALFGLRRGASGYCDRFDDQSSLCLDYDHRPEVCRITDPSRYELNAALCNEWMREAGIDKQVHLSEAMP